MTMRAKRKKSWHLAEAAVLLLLSAACAKDPIALSTQYTPPRAWPAKPYRHAKGGGDCHIHLGDVRDVRADAQAMGSLGLRQVHAADSAAWIRSGLESLNRDYRITVVDKLAAGDPGIDLNVELVKSYIETITTVKSASVVLRVRYRRQGVALDEQYYRGVETGTNWANGIDETQSAFDSALAEILLAIDRDVITRCKAPLPAATAPAETPVK